MSAVVSRAHLSDGELVRIMDGQAEPGEREWGRDHLATCVACNRRLRELRRRSSAISALLAEADVEVLATLRDAGPRVARKAAASAARHRRVVWMRAASIAALVVAAGVLAGPARAWVTNWVVEVWTGMSPDRPRPAVEAGAPPEDVVEVSARVRFEPAGGELSIELASAQDAGRLELRVGDDPTTLVEVLGEAADAELLVLPGGVRVLNSPGESASYRVTVPASVRTVRIFVRDSAVAIVPIDSAATSRTLDLRLPAP